MEKRELSEIEAVKLILSILEAAGRPLTTREIEEQAQKKRVQCPDKTPVFLNRLRLKGIVKGELSPARRGWIWWTEPKR